MAIAQNTSTARGNVHSTQNNTVRVEYYCKTDEKRTEPNRRVPEEEEEQEVEHEESGELRVRGGHAVLRVHLAEYLRAPQLVLVLGVDSGAVTGLDCATRSDALVGRGGRRAHLT